MAEYTLTPTQSQQMMDDDALGASDDTEADDGETCTATVESTGEECGRELPCPYHDD